MKTAISAQDKKLTSPIACHFGRCCFFQIYDDVTGTVELFENCDKGNKECAADTILKCLIEKDVRHIVAADFGKNVQREMMNNEIKMTLVTDCSKTVGDIIHLIERKQAVNS